MPVQTGIHYKKARSGICPHPGVCQTPECKFLDHAGIHIPLWYVKKRLESLQSAVRFSF